MWKVFRIEYLRLRMDATTAMTEMAEMAAQGLERQVRMDATTA